MYVALEKDFPLESGITWHLLLYPTQDAPIGDPFSLLDSYSTKYTHLSSTIWEATFKFFPHSTRSTSISQKVRSFPMNKWYDDECKALHRELWYAFTHSQPFYPDLKFSYHRLLRCKKWLVVSHKRRELFALLTQSPKQLWHTNLPRCSPLPSNLDPTSMFSHTSNLYDILG